MSKYAIRKKVCCVCGAEFETRSGRALYCPRCKQYVASALSGLQKAGAECGGDRIAQAVELAKRRVQVEADWAHPVEHVCPTCGRTFMGATVQEYCAECVEEGLDQLHLYNGWTNGWDKKTAEHVELVDGWRGRPVAGGAHKARLSETARNDRS